MRLTPGVIFADRPNACLTKVQALISNIRQCWKGLPRAKTIKIFKKLN